MSKNIVIVESPAKAKTIEKFLGKDFKVASSFGHIADLPAKELGVDVDNNFKPKYIVSKDKKDVVKNLKTLTDKAETVWLASDEDREGEAISWHIVETLDLEPAKTKRIVFNSITKNAIQKAIENPRTIDYNLVNAQQARRVLDRLVGYELSPILWRKVKRGLSAGRVQSVAVRLIVEREREIKGFTPEASYRIVAQFKTATSKTFAAKLNKTFPNKQEAQQFLDKNTSAIFTIDDLQTKPAKKSPSPPFTTSTLQQEASRKLYFSVGRTMQVAQRLYEAGLITYMRTDSVNLSDEAITAAQNEIETLYGSSFSKPRRYTSKKGAQEAHEAIRPTNMSNQSLTIERDQAKLYDLIWKRTLASQMSDAQLERTQVKIKTNTHNEIFNANGEVLKFEGFLKVYIEGVDDADDDEQHKMLPKLIINEEVFNEYINATERFTRPPYRYAEASLVKKLEELGIGRPSTYAPTISTIQNRGYVQKGTIEGISRNYTQLTFTNNQTKEEKLTETVGSDKGKLVPTDIGMIVNDFLVNHFANILDYNFTAKVEENFDDIASGNEDWTQMMHNFYQKFHPQVEDVAENASRESGERILGKDPKSGRQLSVRLGRYGAMVQIGTVEDEEKPKFASLLPEQSIDTITFEEALELFKLPRTLGTFEGKEVEANVGRYGPYIRFDKSFVSLPKEENAFSVTLETAIELIKQKQKADAPIATYEGKDVTKGKGRFGPFIKWNNLFINVNKKYDFDNLSQTDIETLIADKLKKEAEKVVKEWKEEGIRIEKARWGRFNIVKGKTKIELSKNTDTEKITLEEVTKLLQQKTKSKKKK